MFSSKITRKDMETVRAGLGSRLDIAELLPISYAIDGVKYHGIPAEFNPTCNRRVLDSNIIERTWTAKIGVLTLTVEGFEYKDAPAFEWTAFFTNDGSENSPVISDFCGMDSVIKAKGEITLYHNNGDFCNRVGLETTERKMPVGDTYSAGSRTGRSCDMAWPYYRVLIGDVGFNLAIGWPGTWVSYFEAKEDGLYFRAKQKATNFYLMPGEKVRSPRMLVMGFEGDSDRGVNVWRRYYFGHMLPRSYGNQLAPTVCSSYGGGGEEFTLSTEENQKAAINDHLKHGFKPDIWWIDAGWYPCKDEEGVKRWVRTGDWRLDPEKYPNGLGPVGTLCKENGIQLLLWFEPERVMLKYWPESNPDKYVMKLVTPSDVDWLNQNGLLYLGDDEAREWLTNRVRDILKEGGVEIYRQDFNGDPFPQLIWDQNDLEPNRAGITENKHIQGYLRFWDDLLIDVPDLWIDSCASGGRRNDLEAMRRAVPLHPTDYGYGEHPVKQAFQKTWFEWTPYFRSIACNWDDEDGNYLTGKPHAHGYDSYAMHCAAAPCTTFGTSYGAPDNVFENAVKLINVEKEAASYMIDSDFFCLTPVRKSNEDYFSIQFNREDDRNGLIQVIRNTRCEEESITLFPKCFDNGTHYEFFAPETGEKFVVSGEYINTKGFTVKIPKRSGIFWYYKAI